MLHTRSPSAGETWTGLDDVHGTFAAKPLSRTVAVPPDATEATLFIGLQDSGGTVYLDDVKLTVTAVPRTRPATRPAFTVQRENLRGVMYGSRGKEDDLRTLAKWGANHIRWQILAWEMNKSDNQTPEKYARFIDDTIAEVDRWLPLCEELGIRVLIDLHTPPGGHDGTQHLIFADKNHQQTFIDTWDKLATHFKDRPAVWGYDLVNEPVEGRVPDGLMDWRQLAEHVARRVRGIDPKRAIVIEPGPWGGWDNLAYFEPIDVHGIVYSVHVYEPMLFTHQGVLAGHPIGVSYPGRIDGKHWDRAALEKLLQPVRDYQLDYNVPIYVGEFSAVRWAPGDSAANYLADCISLFEHFGWDWSYHAYREWHGWSLEHGPDKAKENPVAGPNKRREVLLEGFKLNRTAK
jgi:endoglucanase